MNEIASMRPVSARNTRLFRQLADKLAGQIAAGIYEVGERLPAERELAAQHRVSRTTVREALTALEAQGLVEVMVGSGVYVRAVPTVGDVAVSLDVGPFELTEARMLIESEVAALAAALVTDAELEEMDALVRAIEDGNRRGDGEDADRRLHLAIARATRNNALQSVVESLWKLRDSSPQCVALFRSSRLQGNLPVVAEHAAIVNALRARDSVAAREAMRAHMSRVLSYLLDASEQEALADAQATVQARRRRFSAGMQ